jgi:hypothetical protein
MFYGEESEESEEMTMRKISDKDKKIPGGVSIHATVNPLTRFALASCLTVNPKSAHTLRQCSMALTVSRNGIFNKRS